MPGSLPVRDGTRTAVEREDDDEGRDDRDHQQSEDAHAGRPQRQIDERVDRPATAAENAGPHAAREVALPERTDAQRQLAESDADRTAEHDHGDTDDKRVDDAAADPTEN